MIGPSVHDSGGWRQSGISSVASLGDVSHPPVTDEGVRVEGKSLKIAPGAELRGRVDLTPTGDGLRTGLLCVQLDGSGVVPEIIVPMNGLATSTPRGPRAPGTQRGSRSGVVTSSHLWPTMHSHQPRLFTLACSTQRQARLRPTAVRRRGCDQWQLPQGHRSWWKDVRDVNDVIDARR